ncbi:MAG: AMP-binding protein, partial [Clostridia bacterium]
VGMLAHNSDRYLEYLFAVWWGGGVLNPVNSRWSVAEIVYSLDDCGTGILIVDEHFAGLAEGICDLARTPPLFIHAGDGEAPVGMYGFEQLIADTAPVEDAGRGGDDLACILYTGGTTGFPKGVMLTHYNITNNGQFMGDCMKLTERDRLLIVVPLFHCFGCVLGMMSCLTHCTTMVLMDHYNPLREMEILQNARCTAVHGVPTMFIGMLEHPDFTKFDFSLLRTGIMAGSPCPIKTMRDVTEKMHLSELTITYGQTECSPGMTMSRTDDPLELRVTTVGKLLPHTEGRIIDPETGREVARGVPGEICTRGYLVMKGYYKMPEATRQAVDAEGWLHTGDIGSMDEDGNFRITGRLKDMIIRGGENIYPREIEEFLYTHHAVRDVQVVGVPDEKYGEEVCACVVLKEGCAVTEVELIDYVRAGLSRFKAPRYVLVMDGFPMTASGKIQKFKLRELGVERLGLQSVANIETA